MFRDKDTIVFFSRILRLYLLLKDIGREIILHTIIKYSGSCYGYHGDF